MIVDFKQTSNIIEKANIQIEIEPKERAISDILAKFNCKIVKGKIYKHDG